MRVFPSFSDFSMAHICQNIDVCFPHAICMRHQQQEQQQLLRRQLQSRRDFSLCMTQRWTIFLCCLHMCVCACMCVCECDCFCVLPALLGSESEAELGWAGPVSHVKSFLAPTIISTVRFFLFSAFPPLLALSCCAGLMLKRRLQSSER